MLMTKEPAQVLEFDDQSDERIYVNNSRPVLLRRL
jgi:hypothetical protein